MKASFVLLGFLFGSCFSLQAQARVGIVDVNANVTAWAEEIGIDHPLQKYQDSLQQLGEILVRQLQRKYQIFIKPETSCFPSPDQSQLYEDKLVAGQQLLISLDQLMTDSLAAFQTQLTQRIRRHLLEDVARLRASGIYDLLVLKGHLIYQEAGYPAEVLSMPLPADLRMAIGQAIAEQVAYLRSRIAAYRRILDLDQP